MQKYILFWDNGSKQVVEGNSIADACNRCGVGRGALAVLDFFCEAEGEAEWHVLVEDGKHSWIADRILEQFPHIYKRVDAPPPKRTEHTWSADHHYVAVPVNA